ncbi:MAG: HRDC domain-containing protein [Propionibacteriaceae bacterium]
MITESEELPILATPAEGIPEVISTSQDLDVCIAKLQGASGPIAIDAERAQGFRYGAAAWLIQLRRQAAGTFLIDPAAFNWDLSKLGQAIADAEWIIHAATQDLPCLRDVGMIPQHLFDTELAARLLNLSRVGLGAIVEHYCGVRLLKEHSAADWSQRPLPEEWLVYAALDVECLIELRELIYADLTEAGKLTWAQEEFAALVRGAQQPTDIRVDPWRRTSGINALRAPVQLALVRELWEVRDEIAQRLDKGPSRILHDSGIIAIATLLDPASGHWPTREDLRRIDALSRRQARRFEANWLGAIDAVKVLPRSKYPTRQLQQEGPPTQPRNWESRNPESFARWQLIRPCINDLAEQYKLPPENLVSPAALRWLAWYGDESIDISKINTLLSAAGARSWQISLVAAPLADVLQTNQTVTTAEAVE